MHPFRFPVQRFFRDDLAWKQSKGGLSSRGRKILNNFCRKQVNWRIIVIERTFEFLARAFDYIVFRPSLSYYNRMQPRISRKKRGREKEKKERKKVAVFSGPVAALIGN